MTRYAIYFAPPATSPLWRFGCNTIGYDAESGLELPFAETAGLPTEAWREITEEPRRYGFHATLKAPFELALGYDEAALLRLVQHLAHEAGSVTIAGLEVASIGRFIALIPICRSPELNELATHVLEVLQHLRRPLTEVDRARRLKSPLTQRQVEYLDRYGYPYVREEFRFHMTLTGPIADPSERERLRARLAEAHSSSVPQGPVAIDTLAIFRQERRDGRFRIISRHPLRAKRGSSARQ